MNEHRAAVGKSGQRIGERIFLRLLEHDRVMEHGAGLLADALDQAAMILAVPVLVRVIQRETADEAVVEVQGHDDGRVEARGFLAEADHRMYRDKAARRSDLEAVPAARAEFAVNPYDPTRDADAPAVA